jgi:hypothetical protein
MYIYIYIHVYVYIYIHIYTCIHYFQYVCLGRRTSVESPKEKNFQPIKDISLLPIVRVRTRALTSTVSSCPKVQSFLLNQPPPLGRLPTSVIPFTDIGGSLNDSQAISTSQLIAMSQNHVTSPVALSPGGTEENSSELKLAMVCKYTFDYLLRLD